MKITIIGWYGTETLGDRAILAGLVSILNKTFPGYSIYLGSLYPFFSERTIAEDSEVYKKLTGKDITLEIFDSTDSRVLSNRVQESDLLLMGGGPLMDLNALYMVEFAFKKARKYGVKTGLIGCGVGPLFSRRYQKTVIEICRNSDIIILRDKQSLENLSALYRKYNIRMPDSCSVSMDPSVESILEIDLANSAQSTDIIAINLREFPREYTKNREVGEIADNLREFVADVADAYPEQEVRLIPMHYFHIGGDDRVFLNNLALTLCKENITVQNKNLSLIETMGAFHSANVTIGMRFHAVIFQTLLHGNNYIIDYTEPEKGKISGFVGDIDTEKFYRDRYVNIQKDKIRDNFVNDNTGSVFTANENQIRRRLEIYVDSLSMLNG